MSYESRFKQKKDTLHDLEKYASYIRGRNYFTAEDGTQNDLLFQAGQKYFNSNWDQERFLRSKCFFNQYLFFNPANVNNISIKRYSGKPAGVKFSTDFFLYQKDKDLLTIQNPPIINIYITYKTLAKNLNQEFPLRNCLFGAVKITNKSNSDKDMWQYNGYICGNIMGSVRFKRRIYTPFWTVLC